MLQKFVLPWLASLVAVNASLVPGIMWKRTDGNDTTVPTQERPKPLYYSDAPWPASYSEMGNILTCPYGISPRSDVVLLVHGTGSTGKESWKDVYVPVLRDAGYTPCYVDLPQRSMEDNQISAGYVAYNIHMLSSYTQKQVAVISHSSGCPVTQWGLTFWPSVRPHVRAFVALGPDFGGVQFDGITKFCSLGGGTLCAPSLWQQFRGSKFMAALNDHARVAVVPTTVVWTWADELVVPSPETSKLEGATRISVQNVCALRPTDHYFMIFDAVVYALAFDALQHGGHADADRISKKTCLHIFPDGEEFHLKDALTAFVNDLHKGVMQQPKVDKEPDVMPYVTQHASYKEWLKSHPPTGAMKFRA